MATIRTSQCQDGDEVLKCHEERRKPEHMKEHVKKYTNRYFVEKL